MEREDDRIGYIDSSTLKSMLGNKDSSERPIFPMNAISGGSPVKLIKRRRHETARKAPNRHLRKRSEKLKLIQKKTKSDKTAAYIGKCIENDFKWVQENVPVTLLRAKRFSTKWGATRLRDMLNRSILGFLAKAWQRWDSHVKEHRRQEQLECFNKTESAKKVLIRLEYIALESTRRAFVVWTGAVESQQLEEKHAASAEIQRCARRYLLRHAVIDRSQYLSAIRIQSQIRRVLATAFMSRFRIDQERHFASVKLQQIFRRRRAAVLMNLLATGHKRDAAARTIQRMVRGCCSRLEWMKRRRLEMMRQDAARTIQRFFYFTQAKQMFCRARCHRFASTIQRAWIQHSLYIKRLSFKFIDDLSHGVMDECAFELAALIIQCWGRRYIAQMRLEEAREFRAAAISLQSIWRRSKAKEKVARLKHEKQQNRLREYLAACCIKRTIQRYIQGKMLQAALAKTQIPLFMRALEQGRAFREQFAVQIEISAVICLQHTWLVRIRRRRAEEERLERAVLRIQAHWRRMKGRFSYHLKLQAQKEREKQMNEAAIKLQAMYRARSARLLAERLRHDAYMVRLNAATLRVQCAWRCRNGRLAVHLKRQAMVAQQQERFEASVVIQKFTRNVFAKMKALEATNMRIVELARLAERQKQEKFRLEHCVRLIQRLWRTHQQRKVEAMLFKAHLINKKRHERKQKRQGVVLHYLREKNKAIQEELELEESIAKVQREQQEAKAAKLQAELEAQEKARAAVKAAAKTYVPKTDTWIECLDEESGYPYFYNTRTGESKWQ